MKVARDFSFGLYDLDWDAFGGHIKSACHRIPEVAESGIRSTVSGPGEGGALTGTCPIADHYIISDYIPAFLVDRVVHP